MIFSGDGKSYSSYYILDICFWNRLLQGPLAQLVEPRPFKAVVPGSIPGRATIIWLRGGIGIRGRLKICSSQEGVGSSPTGATIILGYDRVDEGASLQN